MAAYAIAQLKIDDPARYRRYVEAFMPTLAPFGGALLAADHAPQVIEGGWPRDKVILLRFPDQERFLAWYRSEAYQRIVVDRHAAADSIVLLVQGLGRPKDSGDADRPRAG